MTENNHIAWNWTDFCPTGITPFAPHTNNFLPCFQEICLQLPVNSIFAVVSAYTFGKFEPPILRDRKQLRLIYLRLFITFILAILPVLKLLFMFHKQYSVSSADILVVCSATLMWVVHSGYLLSLKSSGEDSHRGNLVVNVLLTTIFVLDFIWLNSAILDDLLWEWSIPIVVLDVCYLFTFLPNGQSASMRYRNETINTEATSLLSGNRYVRFSNHIQEWSLGHAQDGANLASKFLFYWVNPLINKGVAGHLKKVDDLFDLPECLNTTRIISNFQHCIGQSKTVFIALHKAFGKEFYLIGILKLLADLAGFAGPLLLGGLISETSEEHTGTETRPYLYALGLFSASLISAFCNIHFNWKMEMVGLKMAIGVISGIYRKALEAQGLQDARPEILNLMSTDTNRIVNACISFHTFWSIPFELFVTLYLLYTQIGAAFIAGLIFAAALIPVNRYLAKRIGFYSTNLMSAKDARISLINETLNGIKQIKLHAWEDVFEEKINKLRDQEVKYLSKFKYLDAWCVYFWATTPVLMCLLTFGVSVLAGNPLTPSTTFASMALLNMLISPLNAFPWVMNGLIEAWVSVKRLQELFDLDNLDFSSYYQPIITRTNTNTEKKPYVLQIKNGIFMHESSSEKQETPFRLHHINLEVRKGELVCIEGPVGGGKTSLISAIVASLNCIDGEVRVHDLAAGFGYVPQTAWLQRGTIRENIIWGSSFDEQRYRNVIFACALNEDLTQLGGDLVGIGENGRTLSGGQRARVALARAVYQDKNVYLLDDILSALDAHVANHVVRYCILGLLKDKTKIIVTNNKTLFYHANQILHMERGTLSISDFMSESADLVDELPLDDPIFKDPTDRRLSVDLLFEDPTEDSKSQDSLMMEEHKESGNIARSVLATYWKSMSSSIALTTLLFVALMKISQSLSDIWLAHWVTSTNNNDTNTTIVDDRDTYYYLGIYTGLAVANSALTLARSFMFAYAGLKAAIFIHKKLLSKVFYTKFQFFDLTSVGRILNRFSSDINTVDDSLPFILNIFLASIVNLIGAIAVCMYAMPWIGLIIIPMTPVYFHIQFRYRHASRDIKRLSSNALSPLFAHFTETLQGITTIRAMRASYRFQRDFEVKLEESIKSKLTASAASQWLSLRIYLLGAFLVGGVSILAAITSAHATNPGLVGLAIATALSITSVLGSVLTSFIETEQEMIAVERVHQYLKLEEEPGIEGSMDPPFGWPTQGVVNFKKVFLAYRDHLEPVIQDISLKTEAFERVAIVGRTGAGKSSVLSALFRVAPLKTGEISVDTVNIKNLSLKVLRDRIVIIPQEPFLFEGTVRENMDPRKKYIDSEIWNAITTCLATPLVQNLGGLDGVLERGGSNLSSGQRQILCLTRAILRNPRIVCIDEGTSNLDPESEAAIQIALKNAFKSSTVFYIAHRLKGLETMDRIFVMDNGKIVEEGTPKELIENEDSVFFGMLRVQNEEF